MFTPRYKLILWGWGGGNFLFDVNSRFHNVVNIHQDTFTFDM